MVSIELLRQIPSFRHLDGEQLAPIARAATLRSLDKDAYLFRAGDRAEALYILISGRLSVSVNDTRGERLQLALVEAGACLGEMGLSQHSPRSADIAATIDSVLLQIDRGQFDQLVREQPAFALSLLADLSKKLQDANRRLENRVTLSVKERLWLVLHGLAQSGKVYPAPKVTHLAAQIDASREMTSKALSQLMREKRVEKDSSGLWRIHTHTSHSQ